ncbi:hypothetical protein H920_10793 [Fukomys damarensis]|uniref:Uncharacterized protein n=1 Tax=Fukomys damarensis TaxID=885580 RepID=A0A091DBD5_FUKDA|nr:hypothetical protein H920_10793 [Fukomys damarensis]
MGTDWGQENAAGVWEERVLHLGLQPHGSNVGRARRRCQKLCGRGKTAGNTRSKTMVSIRREALAACDTSAGGAEVEGEEGLAGATEILELEVVVITQLFRVTH